MNIPQPAPAFFQVGAFSFSAPGMSHTLEGSSPLYARQGEVLAELQGGYREVLAEGSGRQSIGSTNRNRI